jgi:hypothetical protein
MPEVKVHDPDKISVFRYNGSTYMEAVTGYMG